MLHPSEAYIRAIIIASIKSKIETLKSLGTGSKGRVLPATKLLPSSLVKPHFVRFTRGSIFFIFIA